MSWDDARSLGCREIRGFGPGDLGSATHTTRSCRSGPVLLWNVVEGYGGVSRWAGACGDGGKKKSKRPETAEDYLRDGWWCVLPMEEDEDGRNGSVALFVEQKVVTIDFSVQTGRAAAGSGSEPMQIYLQVGREAALNNWLAI